MLDKRRMVELYRVFVGWRDIIRQGCLDSSYTDSEAR